MRALERDYITAGSGGELIVRSASGTEQIRSVSIDSRDIPEDCLFFCILGERRDAHDFIPDVIAKGCRNIVISEPERAEPLKAAEDLNVWLVPDTTKALMALAERYMDDWKGLRKVGVTGSVGKTSTKEFTYSVLQSRFRTGKTPGNLNSEFGVPLTVFGFEEDIEAAVIEMGTGYGGHIAELTEIVKPDSALITTIGTSHMEVFGDRDGLLREKLHIANGFTRENALVINTDCDILTRENTRKYQGASFRLLTVGTKGGEDFTIREVEDLGVEGAACVLHHAGKTYPLRLSLPGAHNLLNAAEAIAAGTLYGIPPEEGIAALSGTAIAGDRLSVRHAGGITVINDSYNASPESMKAGMEVLLHTPGERHIAVLGDMFELGPMERTLHAGVGTYAAERGVDLVIGIGTLSAAITEAASAGGIETVQYETLEEAGDAVLPQLRTGDVVLIKASHSMALGKLAGRILTEKA